MKAGQYYYTLRRKYWCAYLCTYADEKGSSGEKVAEFSTREEAREYVWQMNGWGKPSKPLAR